MSGVSFPGHGQDGEEPRALPRRRRRPGRGYDATRATRDLDAVFIPAGTFRQAAAAAAQHRGLTEDWLNDAVKGFLPGPGPDAQRFYSSDSLIAGVTSRGTCSR